MAISTAAIIGISIGIAIVASVILFFVLRKNKKSKKESPKSSPTVSPASSPTISPSPSTPDPDPIFIANDDGTYAIIDSVESFSRNRPGYGRIPGHYPVRKPDREPRYDIPGFEEASDVEIMPVSRPKPGRDPVYGIPVNREKPRYRIGLPGWGRRERFEETETDGPQGGYVHKTENYLEVTAKSAWDADEPFCGSDLDQCRFVKPDNREDVFWLLSKIYQDTKSISLKRLNELITRDNYAHLIFEIVNKDPLTIKLYTAGMEPLNTFVVGEKDFLLSYMGLLQTAKLTGRPLPRPVESEDYSIKLDQ